MTKPWLQFPGWTALSGKAFPALTARAMKALEPFDRIEDVDLRALWLQKGVGRKTVLEIAEVFESNGYPQLCQAYDAWVHQIPDPAERARRRAQVLVAAKATAAANAKIVEAAVHYVDTGDDKPLRMAVASQRHGTGEE